MATLIERPNEQVTTKAAPYVTPTEWETEDRPTKAAKVRRPRLTLAQAKALAGMCDRQSWNADDVDPREAPKA